MFVFVFVCVECFKRSFSFHIKKKNKREREATAYFSCLTNGCFSVFFKFIIFVGPPLKKTFQQQLLKKCKGQKILNKIIQYIFYRGNNLFLFFNKKNYIFLIFFSNFVEKRFYESKKKKQA